MCTIVIGFQQHPEYPLIVAANRDEFYDRPTEKASFWKEHPQLLAGRDLQSGGTWLGVNKSGRFSALTNYRNMQSIRQNAPSRGHLVLSTLLQPNQDQSTNNLKEIASKAFNYNGFNLVTGTIHQLHYYSNIENQIRLLKPGIYVLSNELLNSPWPKAERARQRFTELITQNQIDDPSLFSMMADKETFPLEKLPKTGLSEEMEVRLSSTFIHSDGYGTRNTTILKTSQSGQIHFAEQLYTDGAAREMNIYKFSTTISRSLER